MLRLPGRRGFVVFMLGLVFLSASLIIAQSLVPSGLSISSTGRISYGLGTIGSNVWIANFETGNLSQFTGVEVQGGNVLEASALHKYNGSYGLHVRKVEGVSTARGMYTVSPVMYDFHLGFAIRYNQISSTSWIRLVELRTGSLGTQLFWMDAEPRIYWMGPSGSDRTSQLNIGDGRWHTIDMYVSLHKNGMVFVYVDGELETKIYGGIDFTNPNGDPYPLGEICIGVIYSDNSQGMIDLSYDDIKLDKWIPPESPPQAPTAEFVFYPTVPKPGELVTFYGGYSRDIDGNVVGYEWTLPDGSKVYSQNASYTFSSEGTYQVTLVARDNGSLTGSVTRTIIVENRATVPVIGGWNLPLRTAGKSILEANGTDVTLKLTGVYKMGFEYGKRGSYRETDPAYFDHDTQIMVSWGVKLVRVPINWYWYMTDHDYRNLIREMVEACTNKGMLVLLDIQAYGLHPYLATTWPACYGSARITYEEGWRIGNDAILGAKAIAHDFLYNPMLVAIEICEFRPRFSDTVVTYDYQFDFELVAKMADAVHAINPNLLIGIEIGKDGWNANLHDYDSIREYCKSLVQSKNNIVYMPHTYFMSRYGRIYIHDMYQSGDFAGGKAEMYNALDSCYLFEQNYYNLPILVSEWSCDMQYGYVVLRDQFDYFIAHNWASTYQGWFFPGNYYNRDPTITMYLLDVDWETPSTVGQAWKAKLATIV